MLLGCKLDGWSEGENDGSMDLLGCDDGFSEGDRESVALTSWTSFPIP
jgi:hypothetical protein